MSTTPPLLPVEVLTRVVRRARINGTWVMVVGSTLALLGASAGEIPGVLAWLFIAGTGAMTLHGVTLLNEGESRGMPWLSLSQLAGMAFVLGLCVWNLTHVDLTPLRLAMTPELRESLTQYKLTEEEFLLLSYRMTWGFVGLVAIFYLGSMGLYYHRSRPAVTAALEAGFEEQPS